MNESNNNQTAKRSYLLRPYREGGKIKCPRCGKKSFTPYIEGATRQVLDDSVGRCDHICSCAYHKTPKEYFEEDVTRGRRRLAYIYSQPIPAPKPVPDKVDLCSIEEWDQRQQPRWSLCADLISHMRRYFHSDKIERVVKKYHIQRYTPQRPYTMFPCIDIHGRVADVAVMEYNEDLHRGSTTFWYHGNSQWRERMAREHPNGYRFGSCFFGEHLLAEDPYSPVAVVESQKTALLGSIFLRGYIWLATCGCGRLNVNMCYRLKGRHVTLFPDKGMEDKWEAIANRVRSNNEQTTPDAHVDISVNRWMDHSPDKPDNTDIADIWMEIFFNIK